MNYGINFSKYGGGYIKKLSLTIHTFTHFAVDFSCFFMLFGGAVKRISDPQTATLGILLYNVLAFGLQPVFGSLADKGRLKSPAVLGLIFMIFGILFFSFTWQSLILCALGNALFHVGGGIDCLIYARGKMTRSGIFVSSGALGVSLGTLAGRYAVFSSAVVLGLLCFCFVLLLPIYRGENKSAAEDYKNDITDTSNKNILPETVILLCSIAVIIRAYVGTVIPIGWKTNDFLFVLPSIAACLGKALGGFLGDIMGARRAGVFSLVISIPFMLTGYENIIFGFLGIMLFNMTMPITLYTIFSSIKNSPGLAFGVTTIGLLMGSMISFFYTLPPSFVFAVITIFTLLSAVCLFVSTNNLNSNYKISKSDKLNKISD